MNEIRIPLCDETYQAPESGSYLFVEKDDVVCFVERRKFKEHPVCVDIYIRNCPKKFKARLNSFLAVYLIEDIPEKRVIGDDIPRRIFPNHYFGL